jgi:hypothetical protein
MSPTVDISTSGFLVNFQGLRPYVVLLTSRRIVQMPSEPEADR